MVVLGLRAVPDQVAYSAAKHGVIGLMKALALRLAPRGITVNALCPGWVDTEMARARWGELGMTAEQAAFREGTSPDDGRRPRGGSPSHGGLKRVVSGRMLLLFVVGDVLGAGIYALVGEVGGRVGGAIWTAFVAAPLRRLSATTHMLRPFGANKSSRMRPT